MTISKMICPVTKKLVPIDIDMPGPQSALPAGSDILGYTFTLSKCPKCGGVRAGESADSDCPIGTQAAVWTVAIPARQAL